MGERRYDQSQAFGGVVDILEAVGAIYAIWGGLAVIAYGESRFTQDMDVLLQGSSLPIAPFIRHLREMRYYVDEQAVRAATLEGGFYNVIHEHYAIKVDFYVPTEPYLESMIAERMYMPFDEIRRAAYITATSVVAAKLRAYLDSNSTRHLDDIAGIIRVQGARLDSERLSQLAAQLGCFGVWRGLWSSNTTAR